MKKSSAYIDDSIRVWLAHGLNAYQSGTGPKPGSFSMAVLMALVSQLLDGDDPRKVFKPQSGTKKQSAQTKAVCERYLDCRYDFDGTLGGPMGHEDACEHVAKQFPNKAGVLDLKRELHMAIETVESHVKGLRRFIVPITELESFQGEKT